MVLRGIDEGTDTGEIREELDKQGITAVACAVKSKIKLQLTVYVVNTNNAKIYELRQVFQVEQKQKRSFHRNKTSPTLPRTSQEVFLRTVNNKNRKVPRYLK